MIAASLYYHVMRPQEKAVATLKNTGRFFITRPPQREGNRLGTCYGRAMSLSNTNTNTRRDETKRDKARDERSCRCYHYRCCCCTSALIVLLDARTTEYWTGTKSAHEAAVAAAAAAALPTVAGSSISWATKLQNSRTLAALSYALSVLKRAAWSSFERAVCLLREFLSVKLAVKPEREWEQHPFSLCYWPSNRFSSLFAVAAANKGTRGKQGERGRTRE